MALAAGRWNPALTHEFLQHCIDTAYDISSFDKQVRNIHLVNICNNSLAGKIAKGYL